jgi:hypothetical protein
VSSAVALRPSGFRSQTQSLFDGAGGEPTLDDVLAGVWEGLAAHATAACPICGERMEPVSGARGDRAPRPDGERADGPEGARCTSCGSSLS